MSEALSVQALRRSGYKVRVGHQRYYEGDGPYFRHEICKQWISKPETKGGVTSIHLTSPDGVTVDGEAVCSKKDVYNKKFGVKVALGRALKQLGTMEGTK